MSQTVDATDNTGNTEIGEVTEVGGGKVWSPDTNEEKPMPLADKLITFGLLAFVIWGLVFSSLEAYAGATKKREYSGAMTPDLWYYGTFGNPGGMQKIIFGTIFLAIITLLVFFMLGMETKIAVPAAIAFGATVLAICLSSYNNVVEWYQNPKTNPVSVWMHETYNYELIDVEDSEIVLVRDLSLGAVKEVKPYFIDDLTYLAVDEADLNKQLRKASNVSR